MRRFVVGMVCRDEAGDAGLVWERFGPLLCVGRDSMDADYAHDGYDQRQLEATLKRVPIERPDPHRRRPQGLRLAGGHDSRQCMTSPSITATGRISAHPAAP
jgi:hypothetical protein